MFSIRRRIQEGFGSRPPQTAVDTPDRTETEDARQSKLKPSQTGQVYRRSRLTIAMSGIRAGCNKTLGDDQVLMEGGIEQRSHADVIDCVGFATHREQSIDEPEISRLGGPHQGGGAVAVAHIRIDAAVQKGVDDVVGVARDSCSEGAGDDVRTAIGRILIQQSLQNGKFRAVHGVEILLPSLLHARACYYS